MPALFDTHVRDFPEKEPCVGVIDDQVHGNAVVPERVEFYGTLMAGCERALPV